MSSQSTDVSSQADSESCAVGQTGVAPALKSWVTPKVITSTLSEDTANSAGVTADAGSVS
jgi:hypothetical protein